MKILWHYFLSCTPFLILLMTATNLWLRNDRDILQGYSKVDNLLVVSVFQRLKKKSIAGKQCELERFWSACDEFAQRQSMPTRLSQ